MTIYRTFLDDSSAGGKETILGIQQDGSEFGVGITSDISSSNWIKTNAGIHTLSKVGIGTTNPQQLLELAGRNLGLGGFGNNTLRFTDTTTTGTVANQTLGKIEWYTSNISSPGPRAVSYIISAAPSTSPFSGAGADLRFGVSQAGAAFPSEAVRIDSAGDVGIGTINPISKLHVYESNLVNTPTMRIENGASSVSTGGGILLNLSFSGDSDVSTGTSAYFVKCEDSDTVLGGIRADSGTSLNYATTSDYRLKENITPLQNGIERVMQLKPCEFTWKRNRTRSDGFIAHEVQEIIPNAVTGSKDAVTEDGDIDPQMIDSSKMIPVLTSALQEAIQRIKYLESVVGMGSH